LLDRFKILRLLLLLVLVATRSASELELLGDCHWNRVFGLQEVLLHVHVDLSARGIVEALKLAWLVATIGVLGATEGPFIIVFEVRSTDVTEALFDVSDWGLTWLMDALGKSTSRALLLAEGLGACGFCVLALDVDEVRGKVLTQLPEGNWSLDGLKEVGTVVKLAILVTHVTHKTISS
jgi:hypothetical protein